jgi:hypothetical protein
MAVLFLSLSRCRTELSLSLSLSLSISLCAAILETVYCVSVKMFESHIEKVSQVWPV